MEPYVACAPSAAVLVVSFPLLVVNSLLEKHHVYFWQNA